MWRFSFSVALICCSIAAHAAKGFYAAAEEWVTTRQEIEGRVAAVRTNIALPDMAAKKEYVYALRITAPFNVHNDRPFPERLDRDGLEKIEEAIELRLVEEQIGVFATIITTNNIREFLLYVVETAKAQAIAEKLVGDIDHHKLSFRLESDPDWEAWSQFARVTKD